jgi:hypothetical protein
MFLSKNYELCWSLGCKRHASAVYLRDFTLALQLVQRLKMAGLNMADARRLLGQDSDIYGLVGHSDEEVVHRIAVLLMKGRLHLHIEPLELRSTPGPSANAATPAFPIAKRPAPKDSPRSTPPPEKIPPTLPANLDAAAQAAVLAEAARAGTPFCAVCAAAAAARTALGT